MNRFLFLVAVVMTAAGCTRSLPTAAYFNADNVKSLQKTFQAGKSAEGPAAAAATAEPTGFATFKGVFKWKNAPPRASMNEFIKSDQSVCAPGGKTVLSDTTVVDADGNLRDVVVYLSSPFKTGDPKWEHEYYVAKKDEQPEFDQKDCVFLSHMFAMRSSQTLKVLNSDPVGHNTNIQGGGKALPANFTVRVKSSETYQPKGESPQPFKVSCSIHPWMSANMLVRSNGLFAVSKADGTFEIPHVPAGVPLEFKVWHEGFKAAKGTVTLNGKETKFESGGKLKFTAEPDKPVELVFEVPDAK